MRTMITVVSILVLGAVSTAEAVTLRTPLVLTDGGQRIDCAVTNFGSKPADVSVVLYNALGQTVTPDSDGCTGIPLASQVTCQVVIPINADAYCEMDAKGKVAAAINLIGSGGDTQDVIRATKK